MKKQVITALAAAMCIGVAGTAAAEDGGPEFTFGASTSFAYDINRPSNLGAGSFNSLSYPSGEQDRSFNIDLIQLGLTGTRGRASYGAKLDFGDLAKRAGDSLDGDIALQEGWIGYDMDYLGLTAGRFGTPIGYEVLEPWGRPNVSNSYTWNMVPVNHDGLKIHGSAASVDMMVGVVNSYSVADDPILAIPANDIDDEKGIIGSIGGAPLDLLNWYVAGIYTEISDTEDRIALNAILSGAAEPSNWGINYALEGLWRQDKNSVASGVAQKDLETWSVAAYFGTNFGPTGLDLRFEYINDGGILTFDPTDIGNDVQLWEITATFSWALVDGVDFRIEYRHDDANEPIYTDNNGTSGSNDVIQGQLVWFPEI